MGPDDIRKNAGEVRVLRRCQPAGQNFAAIVNHSFPGIITLFAAYLREESRETVIVVHGPSVEGMIATLGALNAHTHEDLGSVFGEFQGVGLDLIIIGCWIAEVAFGRG